MNTLIDLLRRSTIRLRMLASIVLVLTLLAGIGSVGLWGLSRMAGLADEFERTTHADAMAVEAVHTTFGEVRRHEKDMLLSMDRSDGVKTVKDKWSKSLDTAFAQLRTMADSGHVATAGHVRKLEELLKNYRVASAGVVRGLEEGAYNNPFAPHRLLDKARAHMDEIDAEVAALTATLATQAQGAGEARQRATRLSYIALAVMLTLAVALVVPLTLANMASICDPIHTARTLAKRIADGDLSAQQADDHPDEPGSLLRALVRMQESLHGIVTQVRDSAQSTQVASSEVASGNQNLSQRTEQTAANLQRTASSMEQLTGTVRQSADSAAQANQLATSASTAAQRGGQVMQQVVSNMNDIASASKRIADIIGTIDGIAFQTNILALNAAVEAARAGEQGRGFAVVAGEVRNLAQRSAEAAKEIKALIGDSVDKVESGAKLVRDAGTAMNDIVSGVQRVSDIIGEISAAAGEQRGGIEQVNSAVNELEQMTQQNAALVEQSAAAAESLREQADKLAGAVSGFRLDNANKSDAGAAFGS